jgi:hypothetical protein
MTDPGPDGGTESQPGAGPPTTRATTVDAAFEEGHFKPTGTIFLLAMFVVTMILLWASVYVILISRGVTT